MKQEIKGILYVLLVFAAFAMQVPAQSADLSEGDLVAALFNDGNWYKGEIAGFDAGRYVVNTPEGRQAYLVREKLKPLGETKALKPGDQVAALFGSEKFYGGTVQKLEGTGAIIKWADGSTPSFVERRNIITGVGDYDHKKAAVDNPQDLISFTVNSIAYTVHRKTGRVTEKGGYVGDFDLARGILTALSTYNASGSIDASGSIQTRHQSGTSSGSLHANGDLYLRGKHVLTIDDKIGGVPFNWNEKRVMALVIAVYLQR
jgi:hypothetical protein